MHPQIRQSEAGDCLICGMDLISTESGDDGLSKTKC
ncbi:MAG: heavy metal-binding domain-containing protein [Flavobacteriaceae bacterium]